IRAVGRARRGPARACARSRAGRCGRRGDAEPCACRGRRMTTLVAADEPHGSRLAAELAECGVDVVALVRPGDMLAAATDASSRVWDALRDADTIVLHATRAVLVPEVIAMCDRNGVRIVPLADRAAERRSVASFGLADALDLGAD